MTFIFVALGGAIGSCVRYAISLIPIKSQFPILTLITNLLGALLIGFIVGIAEKKNLSRNTMILLKTGVCGGFTTFSTFSLEALNLFSTKNYILGSLYISLSVIGCILGVWCGKKLATR
jgi:CrcB protein